MLNIHDLERRWLKYTIKKYIPLVIGIISTFIVLILALIYLPLEKEIKKTSKIIVATKTIPELNKSIIKEVVIIEKKELIEEIEIEENIEIKENTLVLKPSLNFMNNIEDNLSPYNYEAEVEQEKKQTIAKNTIIEQKIVEVKQEPIAQEIKPKKSGLKISVKKENDNDDLKDVIRRFKRNKNPTLSLFIAKRYYSNGEYQKSYNYALMTNEINKDIEESWLIFAKSLVKLGQKKLAVNTLISYLKTAQSTSAQILLRKIKNGDFK